MRTNTIRPAARRQAAQVRPAERVGAADGRPMEYVLAGRRDGGFLDDLADDGGGLHLVKHVERVVVGAQALADAQIPVFLDRIDHAAAPRLDPGQVADRGLRVAQGVDLMPGHAADIAVAGHELAVADNEIGAEQAGLHHVFDAGPALRLPDAGKFEGRLTGMELDGDLQLVGIAPRVLQQPGVAGVDLARRQHGAQPAAVAAVPVPAEGYAGLEPFPRAVRVILVEHAAPVVGPVIAGAVARPSVAADARSADQVGDRLGDRHVAAAADLIVVAELDDGRRSGQQEFGQRVLHAGILVFRRRRLADAGQHFVERVVVLIVRRPRRAADIFLMPLGERGVGQMKMRIDEARDDEAPRGVDDRFGLAVVIRTDMDDFVVLEDQGSGCEHMMAVAVPGDDIAVLNERAHTVSTI